MHVRIGHWPAKQSLCIEFMEHDAQELMSNFGVSYNLSLDKRQIVMEPAYGGGYSIYANTRLKTGYTHCISRCGFAAPHIPAFELMDAELEYQDEYLALELPSDHELPWPSKRTLTAMPSEELEDFCEDAIQLRMNSAVASGDKPLPTSIPRHILKHVAPCAALRCRQAARQLCGQA